jgi:hypothetical protein
MTSDIIKINRLTVSLLEAIEENGGVECAQVPAAFFPEDFYKRIGHDTDGTVAAMTETARQICMRCPIIAKCLEVGMYEDYGIWGGTTPKQREQIKREKEI